MTDHPLPPKPETYAPGSEPLPPIPAADPGPARQYRLPEIMDLTPNDLFAIKMHTKVDLLRPPTTVHGDCALLWWVTRKEAEPLNFEALLALPLQQLNDLLIDPDDEDDDTAPANAEPAREATEDDPKASTNSPESASPSPASGDAPPPN